MTDLQRLVTKSLSSSKSLGNSPAQIGPQQFGALRVRNKLSQIEIPLADRTPQQPAGGISQINTDHRVRIRSITGRITVFPMGLSEVNKSRTVKFDPNKRSPRGYNGLPRKGKELIEDGAVLLYQVAKKEGLTLVLWTVTIPTHYQDGTPLSEADHRFILANWAEIVKRAFEEIARLYERKGIPNRFTYVIEPQEDRFKETGVFAPHIHAVLLNRWAPDKRNPSQDKGFHRSGCWSITTEETDSIIQRVFSNLLKKPVNARASCNLESIRGMKNLFSYLTKLERVTNYISKGSKLMDQLQRSKWCTVLPASWYGSDKQTRREVRSSILVLDIGTATLGEVKTMLRHLSEEFALETGHPLFTSPHLVTVPTEDSGELAVSLVSRVYRLQDVPIAIEKIFALDMNSLNRRVIVSEGVPLVVH